MSEKYVPQKNIRYTTDGQTVTDAQTGLIWDVDTLPEMTHAGAMDSAKLANDQAYKGQKNWRVPTVQELISIVDFTGKDPACDPVFRANSDPYWSSSGYAIHPVKAWVVFFGNGFIVADCKTEYNFVRLVRSQDEHLKTRQNPTP
jgi:hypothetical protein